MEDVILLTEGIKCFKVILELLCRAIGMLISETKSSFLVSGVESHVLDNIKTLFLFEFKNLDSSFKYLGYVLKPNNYVKEDWAWLVRNVDKQMDNWCNR